MDEPGPEALVPGTESAQDAIRRLELEYPQADPSIVAAHLTFAKAVLVAREYMGRRYADFGLSIARFNVLRIIDSSETGRRTMGELSALLGVTPPNITKLVDALEAEGWVQRVTLQHNRRATYLELTPRGIRDFATLLPHVLEIWESVWMGLEPDERRDLTRLLGKITRWLQHPCSGNIAPAIVDVTSAG